MRVLNLLERIEDGWNERLKMLHPVARCGKYHYADFKPAEVLLKLDALIRREENGKSLRCGSPQERTVLEAAPALLLNGVAMVRCQLAKELARQGLIYEDSHVASKTCAASSKAAMACSLVTEGKSARNASRSSPPSR
jgi:hypothetical protein